MYEYKFVTVESSFISGKTKKDYQEIIIKHAKDGWRLNNILQHIQNGGIVRSIDLIFERKIQTD
ncbi:DUF4177 domain-containing protein [Thermoflavimicrobium dichotomicum]|uniref:DUF4177 domain-containing protein n=1 Tax=Thermoflavimicrobium dichotomicum TaxID=46223 RepID=A0A1I3Q7N3_9BACL|nr:DUF4177 domain-containing protein [Thermoflavimicrobium dichotomicum]SFJ29582.1 protein of unknown function [Thermoflavimicrobium dichotomicum]